MFKWCKNLLTTQISKNQISTQIQSKGNYVVQANTIFPYGLFSQAPVNNLGVTCYGDGQDIPMYFPVMPAPSNLGLQAGEVAIGSPNSNTFIKILKDGSISIANLGGDKVKINIDGNVFVNGNISAENVNASGDVTANVSLNSHVHGGVQSGGSTTGAPQ